MLLAIPPSCHEISWKFRDECLNIINSYPDNKKEAYANLYSLTENFFLKNAKSDYSVYVICSAIANLITLQNPAIDGYLFPSVQANTGYNLILRPHVLDNKLILPNKEVLMKKWVISNKNRLTIDHSFHKVGYVAGDNIVWHV